MGGSWLGGCVAGFVVALLAIPSVAAVIGDQVYGTRSMTFWQYLELSALIVASVAGIVLAVVLTGRRSTRRFGLGMWIGGLVAPVALFIVFVAMYQG